LKIAIVTLGCDKNTVDSEYVAGLLEKSGHDVYSPFSMDPDIDAVLINTCGFIDTAKEESVNIIISWAEEKMRLLNESGKTFRLYVVGCLSERYSQILTESIPEIDGIAGVGKWREILRMVDSPRKKSGIPVYASLPEKIPEIKISRSMPRKKLDSLPYSFLKISDGCSRKCSFCAIPGIKGPFRSVPKKILLKEVENMLREGVREINLVAQDLNRYGVDLYSNYGLTELVEDIASIPGKFWIRLLYLYPASIPEKLIRLMRDEEKLCPYLDIPLQHLSPNVLKSMKRPVKIENFLKKLKKWREIVPNLTVRTAFIIGFPGETRSDFAYLLKNVREFGFDMVGVFQYSPEENTAAEKYKKRVRSNTMENRVDKLLDLQDKISFEKNRKKTGMEMEVLIEDYFPEDDLYICRSQYDAPEVDGVILVSSKKKLKTGSFIKVKIREARTHELVADLV
jgi:ribosomal protein S12 methylthiotransferase